MNGSVKIVINVCLLAFVLQKASSQRLGEPCAINKEPGVCKLYKECKYAKKQVEELKKPQHCSWMGKSEVVCCPVLELPPYALGKFGRFFKRTKNGKLVSSTMTCFNEGKMPLKCCHNSQDPPLPSEPDSCPALDKPAKKTDRNIDKLVWEKCVEYQRFVKPCLLANGRYKREDTCKQQEFSFRVENGDPADVREFPHMALLGYQYGDRREWFSGGTLISERYVLTAAHVVNHHQWGDVQFARMGMLKRSAMDKGLTFNVVNRISHSEYRSDKKYNDIALLRLDPRVTLSPDIRPACLPLEKIQMNTLIVTGWGRTGPNRAALSDALLKTYLTLYRGSNCSNIATKKELPDGWSDEQNICAGGSMGHTNDSCEGDSGGPLQTYIDDIHCMYAVVGIVSWGTTECGKGDPAAYVRVTHYLKWITDIVWPSES